jgi:hypothetical protein
VGVAMLFDNETDTIGEEHEEVKVKAEILTPEEDIRKRITKVVDTVKEFSSEYEKIRTKVKDQLLEMIDLGINQYEMEPKYLRDLIDEAFAERGVSLRYLRKLLPDILKDTSKIPLSHIQRQQLKQQQEGQTSQFQKQEITSEAANINAASTEVRAEALSPTDMHTNTTEDSCTMSQESETVSSKEELTRAYEEINRLGEPFTAKTFLKRRGYLIPIVATIDPLKKVIISIQAKWF